MCINMKTKQKVFSHVNACVRACIGEGGLAPQHGKY